MAAIKLTNERNNARDQADECKKQRPRSSRGMKEATAAAAPAVSLTIE
jgi:hypothetical protein